MSARKTLKGSPKRTSLLASVDGPSPCASLDGPKTEKSGPAPAPANLSLSQAKLLAWATRGTYGPLFIGSSRSAALQSSLANRLQARMDVNGSPGYRLTWKTWDMQSGPPICALRASPRRIAGRDFTGLQWATPTSRDWKGYTMREGESICNQLRRLYGGSGKPNPDWIGWLMGFPPEWASSAPTEMPSSRKLRQSS